jgi:steroid delta-isomerase-like uncharacterized protein
MDTCDTLTNKEVVRRHLEVAVNEHRPELWDELMAEDLVMHHPQFGTRSPGRVGYRAGMDALWAAVPDLSVEILDLIAEGDRVVVRYFERGTHRGDLYGVKATGRRYQKHGFSMYRVGDGEITEIWIQEDDLGWRRQLTD